MNLQETAVLMKSYGTPLAAYQARMKANAKKSKPPKRKKK